MVIEAQARKYRTRTDEWIHWIRCTQQLCNMSVDGMGDPAIRSVITEARLTGREARLCRRVKWPAAIYYGTSHESKPFLSAIRPSGLAGP